MGTLWAEMGALSLVSSLWAKMGALSTLWAEMGAVLVAGTFGINLDRNGRNESMWVLYGQKWAQY